MKVRREIFDTYWKLAAERQEIFFKKIQGKLPPYTVDPILQEYKFCNAYRASDRVSQFLIKEVIYKKPTLEENLLFRIFLFRLFNKIETWKSLENKLGEINLSGFNTTKYSQALSAIKKESGTIYGNAFILCANKVYGFDQKQDNHLALLKHVFLKSKIADQLTSAPSLEKLFYSLKSLPLIGNFMAYQLAIDFNYSNLFYFDENDFTVAGPGAIRGIKKCFINYPENFSSIINYMINNQDKEFARLGIKFNNLWGRPLHAIDCQGLFCELDKYSRVKVPSLISNRVKIKSRYTSSQDAIHHFYPPKWGINKFIKQVSLF